MTVKELQDVLRLFDPKAEIKVSSDKDGKDIKVLNKVNIDVDTKAVVKKRTKSAGQLEYAYKVWA